MRSTNIGQNQFFASNKRQVPGELARDINTGISGIIQPNERGTPNQNIATTYATYGRNVQPYANTVSATSGEVRNTVTYNQAGLNAVRANQARMGDLGTQSPYNLRENTQTPRRNNYTGGQTVTYQSGGGINEGLQEVQRPQYQKIYSNSKEAQPSNSRAPVSKVSEDKNENCSKIILGLVALLGIAGVVLGILFGLGVLGRPGEFDSENGKTVLVNNGTWGPGSSEGLDIQGKVSSNAGYDQDKNPSSTQSSIQNPTINPNPNTNENANQKTNDNSNSSQNTNSNENSNSNENKNQNSQNGNTSTNQQQSNNNNTTTITNNENSQQSKPNNNQQLASSPASNATAPNITSQTLPVTTVSHPITDNILNATDSIFDKTAASIEKTEQYDLEQQRKANASSQNNSVNITSNATTPIPVTPVTAPENKTILPATSVQNPVKYQKDVFNASQNILNQTITEAAQKQKDYKPGSQQNTSNTTPSTQNTTSSAVPSNPTIPNNNASSDNSSNNIPTISLPITKPSVSSFGDNILNATDALLNTTRKDINEAEKYDENQQNKTRATWQPYNVTFVGFDNLTATNVTYPNITFIRPLPISEPQNITVVTTIEAVQVISNSSAKNSAH